MSDIHGEIQGRSLVFFEAHTLPLYFTMSDIVHNDLKILIASDIISDYLMFQVLVTTQIGHQICYHVSLLYQNL